MCVQGSFYACTNPLMQTPAQAARALRKFVTQNPQFNETVVVHLLSDIVIRVENSDDIIDDIRGFSDVSL